jgi:predicted DsbA family dithiol-disulfide isomerase
MRFSLPWSRVSNCQYLPGSDKQMKVTIDYFTDPICVWSYASEPTVQSLLTQYRDKVDFRFRSLPILDRIVGEERPGERYRSPEDMQESWNKARSAMGIDIDPSVWQENPPHSSWPANRAMKAAFRQGFDEGNRFTQLLRKAFMTEKRNPSDLETLKEMAERAGLDAGRFYTDMTDNAADLEKEVTNDRAEAMARCINDTPTLVMHSEDENEVIASGMLDYDVCSRAIRSLMGERVIGAPEVEIAASV